MDYLQKLVEQARIRLFIVLLLDNLILIGGWWVGNKVLNLSPIALVFLLLVLAGIETTLIATKVGEYLMQPLKAVWQTVLHISPDTDAVPPKLESLSFGRELVASLTARVYQLANVASQSEQQSQRAATELHNNFVANSLPLPLFVLDNKQNVKFANEAAANYIGIHSEDITGKNIDMVLDMSFHSEDTFEKWLKETASKSATATSSWERVRLNLRDSHPVRLFDLSAYYNRDNSEGNETMLVLFDHTKTYSQDEQAISFIALSVHELRTPLTLLRGYIEVFEEELGNNISDELKDFMQKMHAQAEQLMDYVNNILNVARVDDDQLELRLQQEDWATILKSAVQMISLRAKVRGITIKCRIAQGLPPVAADHLSVSEVISNLVDNAMKYSGTSKVININTYLNQEGLVETTVQDYGKGIPASVIPNLFTKFYRDHHNRAQIGGTGLGLYLCKAIVSAHGGSIWVRSREGEGSVFGFTLIPYAQAAKLQHKGDEGITRSAHGWIKNHSLYRR